MSLHKCEFCQDDFISRPQVKHPRACSKCQSVRQRKNEAEWREKHKWLYSSIDHQAYRAERLKKISLLVLLILQSLKIGFSFFGLIEFNTSNRNMERVLAQFLNRIGLRQINKLWPDVLSQDYESLLRSSQFNLLQTS